jgi:hypothetical protein
MLVKPEVFDLYGEGLVGPHESVDSDELLGPLHGRSLHPAVSKKSLPPVGILSRGGSFPADTNQLLGYLQGGRPLDHHTASGKVGLTNNWLFLLKSARMHASRFAVPISMG